jgi:hypothetical protein
LVPSRGVDQSRGPEPLPPPSGVARARGGPPDRCRTSSRVERVAATLIPRRDGREVEADPQWDGGRSTAPVRFRIPVRERPAETSPRPSPPRPSPTPPHARPTPRRAWPTPPRPRPTRPGPQLTQARAQKTRPHPLPTPHRPEPTRPRPEPNRRRPEPTGSRLEPTRSHRRSIPPRAGPAPRCPQPTRPHPRSNPPGAGLNPADPRPTPPRSAPAPLGDRPIPPEGRPARLRAQRTPPAPRPAPPRAWPAPLAARSAPSPVRRTPSRVPPPRGPSRLRDAARLQWRCRAWRRPRSPDAPRPSVPHPAGAPPVRPVWARKPGAPPGTTPAPNSAARGRQRPRAARPVEAARLPDVPLRRPARAGPRPARGRPPPRQRRTHRTRGRRGRGRASQEAPREHGVRHPVAERPRWVGGPRAGWPAAWTCSSPPRRAPATGAATAPKLGPTRVVRPVLAGLVRDALAGRWGRSAGPRKLPRAAPGRALGPAYRGGDASAKAVHNLGGPIPPAAAEG